MFTELMALLKQRSVMITVSDIGEGLLRINVVPRKIEGESDENTALTSPLSITGRPDELDRDLPHQLSSFTESVLKTATNLEELKAQHAAAVKALDAENKKKLDEKKKANGSKVTSVPPPNSPEFKDGKPVFGSKTAPASAENGSLFEAGNQAEGGAALKETNEPTLDAASSSSSC